MVITILKIKGLSNKQIISEIQISFNTNAKKIWYRQIFSYLNFPISNSITNLEN